MNKTFDYEQAIEKLDYIKKHVVCTQEYIYFLMNTATEHLTKPLKKECSEKIWENIAEKCNQSAKKSRKDKEYELRLEYRKFLTAIKTKEGIERFIDKVSNKVFCDWQNELKFISSDIQKTNLSFSGKVQNAHNITCDLQELDMETRMVTTALDQAKTSVQVFNKGAQK